MIALVAGSLVAAAPTATASPADQLVSTEPSEATPNIGNGETEAITQVGDKIIVGGTFTTATDRGGDQTLTRNRLLAFDADTGELDTAFDPDVQGGSGVVRALQPGPTADTVYVGGSFTSIGGTTRRHLALVSTETGEVVDAFEPPTLDLPVRTLGTAGSRLLVGGDFTKIGGTERRGLASLDGTTGAPDSYLDVPLTGHHNWTGEPGQAKGGVGAREMDVASDGSTLVVVGNFTKAGSHARDQLALIDLGADAASVDADWSTTAYEDPCNAGRVDTYVKDVDFAPDGSYFVAVTNGGHHGADALCDSASRFETGATGSVNPTWSDFTGADSIYSVAVSEKAVYVGGHQRWQNNRAGHSRAGQGAVPRPGIAALDPRTGTPVEWNPGRHPRGKGVYALELTDSGLYVGQDTDYIGRWRYRREKIAFFPFAGGAQVPAEDTGELPGDVYFAGPGGAPTKRSFDGSSVGADEPVTGTGAWSDVRGTFMVNGTLYYGTRADTLRKRTFDGTTFGSVSDIDPYNDPAWSDVQTGSGQTYRGVVPNLYQNVSDLTGMAYVDGRLYYTKSTTSRLYWRTFNPKSGVVGSQAHVASEMARWNVAGGMFFDGDTLYFPSRSSGNLYRTAWSNGEPEGSLTAVSGPDIDGRDWSTRAMFLLG